MTHGEPPGCVALLGLGVGGGFMARALGELSSPPRLVAHDAGIADERHAPRLRAVADRLGVELHGELGPWLAAADVVVSLVPGSVAVEAAEAAAAHMRRGAVLADLNSITGDMMYAIAAATARHGIATVDGAVLGTFESGDRIPVLLAGPEAARVVPVLPEARFLVRVIEGRVGDASAIKMLRSVVMKGLEALCVECLVAAEVHGVRHELSRAFDDLDGRPFQRTMELLTRTHIVHAGRRLKEVERVASVLEDHGVAGTMTEATRALFDRTVAGAVRPLDGEPLPLDETLRVLRRLLAAPREGVRG